MRLCTIVWVAAGAAVSAMALAAPASAEEWQIRVYDTPYGPAVVRGTRPSFPRCYNAPPYFCGPRIARSVQTVAYALPAEAYDLATNREVAAPLLRRGHRWRHVRRHRAVVRALG